MNGVGGTTYMAYLQILLANEWHLGLGGSYSLD
jgi:hypothetical protein